MALTQISTAGVKDDAVTAGKIPANAVGSSELADNAVDNAAVASNAAIAGTKISPDFGSQNIVTTGNVGIGTTSPSANLHVHTDANGEGVLIKSTGNTSNALTFDANRGTEGVIAAMYGRWNGTTVAQISFTSGADGTNKDDGIITFGTESAASNGNVNASEKMRIDSSGNVGIGCTPSNGFLEVKNTSYNGGSTGLLTLEGGSESGVMFKTSSYGNDQHKIATNNNGHMFFRVAAGVRASLTSNGLCFNSDTAAANALDDYEEGTFTFSLGHSLTPTETDGTYTKIGNFCIAAGSITFPSTADGNHAILGGLPFTAANGRPGAAIVRYSNDNEAYKISWHVNAAAASASPYYSDGGGTTANVYFSTKRLDLVFCYRTA